MATRRPSAAVITANGLLNVMFWGGLLFGVLAIASVVVGVVTGGESILYGERLGVPLELNPADAGPLPASLSFSGWPDVTAWVENPTTKQMLLLSATGFGPLALFIAGVWLLRGFGRSVEEGDPFGAANATRLRRLGFVLIAGAPLVELLNTALRTSLYNDLPSAGGVDVGVRGFSLPLGAMLGGLAAFILAQVFAYGTQLREDVEGTV